MRYIIGLFKKNLSTYLQLLLIFTLTLIIAGFFSTIGVDPHHDGIILKPALDVANGKILFKETFTQYGALTTLIQSLALLIFGKYLIVIRLLTVFIYGLISIFIWLIWSRFLPKFLVTLTSIVWILLAPYYHWTFLSWSSVYALFFQVFTAYLIMIYFEKKRLTYLFLAGIFTALTFWSRQPVGIFLLISIIFFQLLLVFINKRKFNEIALYVLGFISINIIFLIWLSVNGAVKDWWLQSIQFASYWGKLYLNIKDVYKNLLAPSYSSLSIWTIFPIACIIIAIKKIVKVFENKKISEKETKILALCFISLASWLQYYPINCIRHTYWAATPMVGLFTYFIFTYVPKFFLPNKMINSFSRYLLFFIVFSISLMPDVAYRMRDGYRKINQKYVYIDQPTVLKNIKLTQPEALFYKSLTRTITNYLKSHPNTNLVTTGPDALYLSFINNQQYFHPVYINWEIINSSIYPDYLKQLNQYIEANKPLVITTSNNIKNYCQLKFENKYNNISIMAPCSN